MFSLFDSLQRRRDGLGRRELLRIGGLSALGMSLPQLLQARETLPGMPADATFGRAKSVIFLWLQGGPPQHETWDPKPDAPAEIRGPFAPIATNVPGIDFCELLPRSARIADKLAVIRSLSTDDNNHDSSGYQLLTGYKYIGPNSRTIQATDWPYFGSLVKRMKPSDVLPPLSSVWLPDMMRLNENVTPAGQTGGFMGRQWDPERFVGDPSDPNYQVEGLKLTDLPPLVLRERATLLEQVQAHFAGLQRGPAPGIYQQQQAQAFELLTSDRARRAFAIQEEPADVRERYGRFKWGQCTLLARRLVEAGVRLVHVNWPRDPGDNAVDNPLWDTHAQNADRMEDVLCPQFDQSFAVLLDDLEQRGLLAETLVVAIGEFGRTPKFNGVGGRDHWGHVFSAVLAGAGIRGGQVYGASDKQGAYPAADRVLGGDFTATLFHLLGIDPQGTFLDAEGRERFLTRGQPLHKLLGTEPATARRREPGGDPARLAPYDDRKLWNTDFADPAPLLPAEHGSRPKGWRGHPLATSSPLGLGNPQGLGVQLVQPANDGDQDVDAAPQREPGRVLLGLGLQDPLAAASVAEDSFALLAQEFRNPRIGRYNLLLIAHAECSNDAARELLTQHFQCRLVLYRYADNTKNPLVREEVAGVDFTPAVDAEGAAQQPVTLEVVLDSGAPGTNFSIGNGLGMAVVLRKKTPGLLELPAATAARQIALCVDRVELAYAPRGINDQVTV